MIGLVIKMSDLKCPFCAASQTSRALEVGIEIYRCGTRRTEMYDHDNEPIYETGCSCDKTVLKSQLTKCQALLEEVRNSGISFRGTKYSEVQIPHELMKAIEEEVENYDARNNI